MPQTIEQKLDVLGSFAAADRIRKVWGTKLLVSANGDMQLQEAGFATFWGRNANDSLTNPAVHNRVEEVFDTALTRVHLTRYGGNQDSELQQRVLYAFKGYSTLVRRGYDHNVLRAQVQRIAGKAARLAVPIVCTTYFDQSDHIPEGSRGLCYGLTVDWLRRSYKQKYGYDFGLIQTRQGETSQLVRKGKLASIVGLQENQSLIRNDGSRETRIGYEANMFRDVPIVSNRLSKDVGRNREAAYARRFAGMTLHTELSFRPDEAEQRCCGIAPVGSWDVPRLIRNLEIAMDRDLAQANGPCGWLISLGFADFFTGSREVGHAIGMFCEGANIGRYHCFDPNHGTVSGFRDIAWGWLQFSILRWSLLKAVPEVSLNRVSARP
jgi:hypothetical protein